MWVWRQSSPRASAKTRSNHHKLIKPHFLTTNSHSSVCKRAACLANIDTQIKQGARVLRPAIIISDASPNFVCGVIMVCRLSVFSLSSFASRNTHIVRAERSAVRLATDHQCGWSPLSARAQGRGAPIKEWTLFRWATLTSATYWWSTWCDSASSFSSPCRPHRPSKGAPGSPPRHHSTLLRYSKFTFNFK